MKKINNAKLIVSLSVAVVAGVVVTAAGVKANSGKVGATATVKSCNHVGYHYDAKEADCGNPGNAEFWACCECHSQFLEAPSTGKWTDAGSYTGELESTHIAYVAPTGLHEYNYHVVDSTETAGDIDIVKSCDECGELKDSTIYNTMTKKVAAEYVIDLESRVPPWTKTGDNEYTSHSGTDNTTSWMVLVASTSGSFSFSYDVSTENKWDKFYVGTTSSNYDILGPLSGTATGSKTVEVEAGDSIFFRYAKDTSGYSGRDNVIVTFADAKFEYDVLEYVVNGGTECAPSFIENGALVGETPTPTKDNAYFEGWYVDAECTEKYVAQTFTGDAKLYAAWSDPCIVTLDYNYEGRADDKISYKKGSTTAVASVTAERSDYYFLGWYTDEACTTKYVDGIINANITVYAKWVAHSDAHALYGDYKGFKVYKSSWSGISVADSYAEASIGVDGSISLRTAWNTYVDDKIVSYDAVSGEVTTEGGRYAHYDSTDKIFVICQDATMGTSSYTYVLRRDATSTSKMSGSAKDFNSNKFTFVQFTVDSNVRKILIDVDSNCVHYNVSFEDLTGNAISVSDLSSVSKFIQLVVKDVTSAATIYTFGAVSSSEISTEVDKYFGTYTADDGETFKVGATGKAIFSKATSSSIVSYTELSENVVYVKYASTVSMNLTLNLVDHTFTYVTRYVNVTFDENYVGGATSTTQWVYDVYTSITIADPTRAGYSFDGWYTAATGGEKITGTKALKEDTTFYAHWLEAFTVTCVLNNGEDNVLVSVADGKTGTYPTPTLSGHYFEGWYTDSELTEKFDTATEITESITIYANYEENVPFAGHYTSFNLCTSTVGYSTNTPNSYIRGTIGDNGVGTDSKFSGWKFVDAGEGRYTCSSSSYSDRTGSYAIADDGTYFICTHYSGPNADPVPTDNLFGVNTGDAYATSSTTSYKICRIAQYIWIVKVTVGSNSYLVYCDAVNDIFEADVTFTSNSSAIDFDSIYDGTNFVTQLTIARGSNVLANCTCSEGDKVMVVTPNK